MVLFAVANIYAFRSGEINTFRSPSNVRIVFWHLPSAIWASVLTLSCAYFGFKFLSNKNKILVQKLGAVWEIATVFATIAIVTGIIFSKTQWGNWWDWDPRQTSYLIVCLLLFAGLVLRSSIADEEKRDAAFSGYAVMTVIPMIFLTFVMPRLPQVRSLHPSNSVATGAFNTEYRIGLYLMAAALVCITAWAFRQRIEIFANEARSENNEREPNVASSPNHHVVRPIDLSDKS